MAKFSLSCLVASAEHLIEREGEALLTFIGFGEDELRALGAAIAAALNKAPPPAPAPAPVPQEESPPPSA